VPFTFGVERPSFPSEYEGVMVFGALANATVGLSAHAMVTNKPLRFPRAARLLRHADFERVYKEGKRHFSATITVFYLARGLSGEESRAGAPSTTAGSAPHKPSLPHGLRVGFTVGKVLGGAVQRNRMKRRLREAVRLTRPATKIAADVVINPKKALLAADFEDVKKEVGRAFEAIERNLSPKQIRKDGV
jgi:ribonuclease P protein component